MQEIKGDLFASLKADAICITTNGYVSVGGNSPFPQNTMGKGCAGEAKKRWNGLEFLLGTLLMEQGNHVHQLTDEIPDVFDGAVNTCGPILTLQTEPWVGKEHILPYHLVSFPTKPTHAEQERVLRRYADHGGGVRGAGRLRGGRRYPGWMAQADMALIKRSARELRALADEHGMPNNGIRWESIVLPRPGCGAGELSWDEVRPVLNNILDDRFYAITFE